MIFLVSRGRNKRGYKINDFSVWLFLWGSHFSRVLKNKDAGTTGALPRHFRGSVSEAPRKRANRESEAARFRGTSAEVLRKRLALPRHFRGSASEARRFRLAFYALPRRFRGTSAEVHRKLAKSASEARQNSVGRAQKARRKRAGSTHKAHRQRVGSASEARRKNAKSASEVRRYTMIVSNVY